MVVICLIRKFSSVCSVGGICWCEVYIVWMLSICGDYFGSSVIRCLLWISGVVEYSGCWLILVLVVVVFSSMVDLLVLRLLFIGMLVGLLLCLNC